MVQIVSSFQKIVRMITSMTQYFVEAIFKTKYIRMKGILTVKIFVVE